MARGNIIDRERVCAMYRTGFSQRDISNRLGVSARQVNRILRDRHVSQDCVLNGIVGTDKEYALWQCFFESFLSYAKVAYLFGVSRQMVWEKVNEIREAL